MPLLRCLDPDCGHEWYEPSHLGEGADCVECGGPTTAPERDEWLEGRDASQEMASSTETRPRIAFAREAARALLKRHGFNKPPILVRQLAAAEGLEILVSSSLPPDLRARLVGDTIQVAQADAEVVKRFSIAHEVGHHRLGTTHDQGRSVETEADAFAGELLVPGPMLLEALRETTDARGLARLFNVSHQVVRIAAELHRRAGDLT
jgi:hypothetical protein